MFKSLYLNSIQTLAFWGSVVPAGGETKKQSTRHVLNVNGGVSVKGRVYLTSSGVF